MEHAPRVITRVEKVVTKDDHDDKPSSLLEEIEMATGRRISLSKLAEANLGVAKDHHGSQAIEFYRNGEVEKLKEYCLKDVELTKRLYDLYLTQGSFLIPNKETGEKVSVLLRVAA